MRPGRQLAFLGAIFVILGAVVWFGGKGGWQDRLEPRLGLDLVGGTQVTLTATTKDGNPPNRDDLEQARQIIEERVNARGVSEAEVVTEGNSNIVISVASRAQDALKDVGQASKLFFRKVITLTDGSGPAPAPTVTPSAAATPNPSGSATPSPTASGSGGGSAVEPSATPTPTPTASGSPSAGPAKRRLTEDELKARVGAAAWDAAKALTAPVSDPAVAKTLEPFAQLDAQFEVTSLSPEMQFYVPQINCEKLDGRVPGAIDDPKIKAVACQGQTKFLLDVAKVAGTDIDKATPQIEQNTGQRVVSLNFTGDGQTKWTELTREAFNNSGDPKCDQSALGDQGKCLVAVVLDNKIVSAPEIQGVLTGTSQISGQFDAKSAQDLANNLNFGALAVSFTVPQSKTVTATLGAEYLKAGLLAAGVGMLLVIVYSFFYYRLLGSVIFLSLVLSGLLTFLMLIFLGRQMGFTLTLAGIAGFIVSLGVAADSFVIYFERLKDEIREGRSPRSAVQRAWIRARKTILTANAISLMAAVILYLFSSGPVAGFAFALGMATALDLVVVFLFRYPIMAMFARTPAFLSPRVSGLGRVLREAKETN
ncbi:MAG TPA: protein translocase subunit SecD [Micromonosporaceae bacterium]|nr:protein translocase subunit SecD [Micromonosporaceae bacterium]